MAGQYTRCRNDNVDGLHECNPFYLRITSEAKGASIVQGAQDLPGAHVEGDIEKLADSHPRAHSNVAR